MRLVYPDIQCCFDTELDRVNCIVIENQQLFYSLLRDIENQFAGFDGVLVVSENGKPLKTDKYLEVLSQFFPFDINKKSLLNKITAELEAKAVSTDYYEKTVELLSGIEQHLINLAFDFSCDVCYNKLDIGSIVKAAGVQINDTAECLSEKIIDYIELVTEFDRKKLFITVNLRSFISDSEASLFMQTAISHGYHIIMLENCEHTRLDEEKRYIVDRDLCEIC